MQSLPLRIPPGKDLREALENALAGHGCDAAFLIAGMGSLATTRLRFAGATEPTAIDGVVEILTLAGTLSVSGAHLHMSVADAQGQVFGGHVAPGCTVRTTAEVLVVLLPEWSFTREPDSATGYRELVARRKA
jgi:uncharacterized protein